MVRLVIGCLLVASGAFLVYDSLAYPIFGNAGGAEGLAALDLKALGFGVGFSVAGFLLGRRPIPAGTSILLGASLVGFTLPFAFGIELVTPLPVTSRTEVTRMDQGPNAKPMFVRDRYLMWTDDPRAGPTEPPQLAPLDTQPRLDGLLNPIEPKSQPNDAELERTIRAMIARREAEKAREAASAAAQTTPKRDCMDNSQVDPRSNELVEKASGSIKQMMPNYAPDAAQLLEDALQLDPSNMMAHTRLGLYYQNELNDPGRAVALHQDGLKRFPECGMLYFDLANAQSKMRRYSEAIANFRQAIRFEAEPRASYRYNLGNALLKAGQPKAAVVAYLKTIELQPDHPKVKNNLTHAYLNAGQYDALRALHAKDPDALRRIGVTLNRKKKTRVALRFFQQSLDLQQDAETYIQKGIAHGVLKELEQARLAAEKALALKPGHPVAKKLIELADKN